MNGVTVEHSIHSIAMIAGIVLPIWNLPLIVRVVKRRSSEDISMYWALGVWVCLFLMVPSALLSKDPVWRVFSVLNFTSFCFVVFFVLAYRKKR